jgi:hypothetical protein
VISYISAPPCCCQPIDYDDEDEDNNSRINDDYDEIEGRYSPKKVTFSEYDQVKLMSMESLLSAATSDASTMDDVAGNGGVLMTSGIPPKSFLTKQTTTNGTIITNSSSTVLQQEHSIYNHAQLGDTPKRNQRAQDNSSRLV